MLTTRLAVRVPDEILKQIEAIARAEHNRPAAVIRRLISTALLDESRIRPSVSMQ